MSQTWKRNNSTNSKVKKTYFTSPAGTGQSAQHFLEGKILQKSKKLENVYIPRKIIFLWRLRGGSLCKSSSLVFRMYQYLNGGNPQMR
jgi:hypothetical protein